MCRCVVAAHAQVRVRAVSMMWVRLLFLHFPHSRLMHGKIWFSKRCQDEWIARGACQLRADVRLFSFAMQQIGPRFNWVVSSYRKRVQHIVLFCNPLLNYIGASNFNGCTLYTEKALSVWTEKKKRFGVHANTSAQLYFMYCIRLSWARGFRNERCCCAANIFDAVKSKRCRNRSKSIFTGENENTPK